MGHHSAKAVPATFVGPNALGQTAIALNMALGSQAARSIFAAAGLAGRYDVRPDSMIDQGEPARLFKEIQGRLGRDQSDRVLEDAGRRTGDYLLANRIPAAAQAVLRALPPGLSARLLVRAISRNAWTFCGTGQFFARVKGIFTPEISLSIAANPLATPGCPWHCAVFERLFSALVSDRVDIRHPECCAEGHHICRTNLLIRPGQPATRGP